MGLIDPQRSDASDRFLDARRDMVTVPSSIVV